MESAGLSVRPSWRARRAVGVVAVAVAGLLAAGGVPSAATTAPTRAAAVLPSLAVSRPGLNFPDQPVGTSSAPQGLTISNDGTATAVLDIAPIAAPYAIASDLCDGRALAPGAACVLTVLFAPTQPGDPLAAINISSQTGGAAEPTRRSVNLTGHAVAANAQLGETSRVAQVAGSAAISDNGRYLAWRTSGAVAGVDVPDTIQMRDQATRTVSPVSATGHDATSGPSISGDGRLIAYAGGDAVDDLQRPPRGDIWVADRGPDLAPGAPSLHQVTGVASDLPYQREPCADYIPPDHCGPQLSGDGKVVVYPAQLDPESTNLHITVPGQDDFSEAPLVDFSPESASPTRQEVTITVNDDAVTFSGPPVIEGRDADAFRVSATTCDRPVAVAGSCTIDLELQPANPTCGQIYLASLRTVSAVPLGQTAVPLIATDPCQSPTIPEDTLAALPPLPPTPCPQPQPVAGGEAPAETHSPSGRPMSRPARVQLGLDGARSGVPSLVVTNNSGGPATLRVDVADCGAGLVVPGDPPNDVPDPCEPNAVLTAGEQCTAFMTFTADSVGVQAASLAVTPVGAPATDWEFYRFYSFSYENVLLMRQDPSGAGDFAGTGRPAPEIVSVDSDGVVLDAVDATISGDGRFIAFSSSAPQGRAVGGGFLQVYRHDRQSGETARVSILPDGSVPLDNVDWTTPSISRDGNRVAFASLRSGGDGIGSIGEVYVRDLDEDQTVLASARAVNPDLETASFAGAPGLSDDGTTVAYVATGADLVTGPAPPFDKVFVRYLAPDFDGAPDSDRFNELIAPVETESTVRAGFAAGPVLDEDGSFVAFGSIAPLVVGDTDEVEDIYVHRRAPQMSVQPVALDFGQVRVNAESDTQTVTVSNAGPGPVRLGSPNVTHPFFWTDEGDGGWTGPISLHRGESLTLSPVGLQPPTAAQYDDLLMLPNSQGYLDRAPAAVTLSGLGVVGRAALSVTPGRLNFTPHTLHIPGSPLPVVVRNVGNVPLEVGTTLTSPAKDYTIAGTPCSAVLDPGEQCRIPVAFAPRKLGPRDGTLTVSGLPADVAGIPPAPPATVELVGTTIQPTLVANPVVVRPGRIANATGKNFPPDLVIKVAWTTGLGMVGADPNDKGELTAPMLIFDPDVLGARQLVATIPGVGAIKSEPVLVVPLTGQPPDFVNRS